MKCLIHFDENLFQRVNSLVSLVLTSTTGEINRFYLTFDLIWKRDRSEFLLRNMKSLILKERD